MASLTKHRLDILGPYPLDGLDLDPVMVQGQRQKRELGRWCLALTKEANNNWLSQMAEPMFCFLLSSPFTTHANIRSFGLLSNWLAFPLYRRANFRCATLTHSAQALASQHSVIHVSMGALLAAWVGPTTRYTLCRWPWLFVAMFEGWKELIGSIRKSTPKPQENVDQ